MYKKLLLAVVMIASITSVVFSVCPDEKTKVTKEKFAQMPAFQKADAWKAHLTDILSTEPLTDAQRAVIISTIQFIRPSIYSASGAEMGTLRTDIEKNFTPQQVERIFLTLNADTMLTFSMVKATYRVLVACSCSHEEYPLCKWCVAQPDPAFGACERSVWGCGYLWRLSCTGHCWNPMTKDGN